MKNNVFNLNTLRDAIIYKYKLMGLGVKDLRELPFDFTTDWNHNFCNEFSKLKKELMTLTTLTLQIRQK